MSEKQEFDQFAKDYRQIHDENIKITGGSSTYFAEYKVELVERLTKGYSINDILDLGCGDGLSSFFFNSYFPTSKIRGIDPSGESIKEARDRNISSCEFQQYDGHHIPFPNNSFDLIFLSCILHHVPAEQHPSLLTECRRVLRDGGYIFIFEHNPNNPLTRKIVRDCEFDADAVLIRSSKLKQMLNKTHFRNVKIHFTLFFPRHPLFRWLFSLERLLKRIPAGGQYAIYGQK